MEGCEQGRDVGEVARKEEWTAEDARLLIEAQQASGMLVVDFARQHGFIPQRLHRWKGKLKKGKAPVSRTSAFVPVRVVAPSQPAGRTLEVMLAGGRSVRVGTDFDASLLQRVVAALEGTPC